MNRLKTMLAAIPGRKSDSQQGEHVMPADDRTVRCYLMRDSVQHLAVLRMNEAQRHDHPAIPSFPYLTKHFVAVIALSVRD